MNNLIGIISYGAAGNIHSVKKAIEQAGAEAVVIKNKSDLKKANKIIIPGVGSFKEAMQEIASNNLLEPLSEEIEKKTTLGICLGMQILSTLGFEGGQTRGLHKINAEVRPILVNAKIPHMGFNKLKVIKPSPLLTRIEDKAFYFMHSYEVINYTNIVSLTSYAGHEFVSCMQKNNIYGVQFHPEKSRDAGIQLFKNFINIEK